MQVRWNDPSWAASLSFSVVYSSSAPHSRTWQHLEQDKTEGIPV